MFSYLMLQQYWWIVVSLLGGLFVFLTFVQGGQTLLYTLGKTEEERDVLVNAIGKRWELTFTTLVLFGGGLFAAFPLFYSVSFGGAYYVWMAILFCFIVQAVSYEYRKKPNNLFGERFYEILLYINGSVGIFLIGAAVATLFTGGNFVVNENHLSHWTVGTYGLEAVFNPFNDAFGLMLVFLARTQAGLYFLNTVDVPTINERAKKVVKVNFVLFLIFFLYVTYEILTMDGFRYDPKTLIVSVEHMKFFHSLMDMPIVAILLLVGVLSFVYGVYSGAIKGNDKAFWISSLGVILVVFSLFIILGLDNSAYYPSLVDPQSSLTIQNSSGSYYTLAAMSIVSLMVPFVILYIALSWRSLDKTKMTIKEVESETHY